MSSRLPTLPRLPWRHAAGLLLSWLAATALPAAVFDFSARYPDISASSGSGTVTLSVYDEAAGAQRTTNILSASTFDLTSDAGVAAWSSGTLVYYYTYDPALGRWVGESGVLGSTSDLRVNLGVVTWSTSAGAIRYRVYDRQRRAWMAGSANTASTANLRSVDGVIAWSTTGGAYARVYDPILGSWRARDLAPLTVRDLVNADGVVAVSSPVGVTCLVYDPTRGGWTNTVVNSGATSDLRCRQGVAAWSVSPIVYYSVYDPVRGQWMNGSANTGYTADLAIQQATVQWTTTGGANQRGYDPGPGTWGTGPSLRLAAFTVSTNAANAPLTVQFIDMSLAGLGWSWTFGDGDASSRRSPTHTYTNLGAFPATLVVSGSTGTSSTNRLMVTDVTAPTGTVVVNGGDSLTTNPVVMLTLSATDNSGVVTHMRLSNTGSGWNAPEPYATTRAWSLGPGDGVRSVYVQFADAATNFSASASDSITLDTSPLPVASVPGTNVLENAGSVTVRVVLSAGFSRTVTVGYATSNGTAVAGLDYTAASGTLNFTPGTTVQTFTVPVTADPAVELNETFHVHLTALTNAQTGPPGVITIVNDDQPSASFAATNFNALESAGLGVVTVQLNGASGQAVTIGWTASNGTATAGLDFVPTNGVVVIPSGETNATFSVRILNDTLDEVNETILLRLTGVTNALLTPPTNAWLTLVDDDAPRVSFSAPTYLAFEHDGFALVNVWLSKPVADTVEFDYLVLGGTASPSDYLPASGHRVFSPGVTNVVLVVNLTDDTLAEPDETVHLALSNFLRAEPGPYPEADVVIYDDDRGPRLIQPRRDAMGVFHATARGKPGQRFLVEISSDLNAWVTLLTLTNNGTGTLEFSDPAAASRPIRFYRTSIGN